ncbi:MULTISPECIES: restriction endonuclease subunit S [Acinetobacter calcoaceticus/baumannii complex]|uniref:restriction endonuclease subunit S n=1 Tax=Acinetobacter calcoaceticus/baumannii complex TaxID=909768 RepID=UPI000F792057|nr:MULTISPECIES: restriction endonuclease subunit S [Acinetobacter calcoaceticus/baumannii complex]RSO32500.1 restriction endonuclease subunit S [Acinetobacter lactucae]RZH14298.1 restriction endonuclease subunit S [Acinetobacter pittii]
MAVPKLRFKEFNRIWSKYDISEVTEYLVDGTHFSPKSTDGEFKYITSKNIRNDGLDLSNISYISRDEHNAIYKRCKVQLGDILLTKDGANTGNCCLNTLDEEFSLLSSVAVLRGKKKSFDNNFILQILQSDVGQSTITSSMAGQAITRITLAKIKGYTFKFPEFEEQTKITSFLTAVDEKISQLNQKYELLSQYKQGMMQKFFSQQIRFKADDGSEFGEWVETNLSEIIKFVNGKGHENDVDERGSFTLINSKFISTDGIVSKNVNKCHQKVINECLVMVMSDIPNGKALAKVLHISDGSKFALNQRIGMFIFSKENYPKFFQYQLNRHKYYLSFDSGVGQTNLKKEDVLGCPTFIPCLEEQTKIANFLSAIDQKIEVVAKQIEQAKQWKKGLLQQMFV